MKKITREIAKEIFTNPRLQAFFENPPPEGPTEDGDRPATEEAEEIIDELATTIDNGLERIETTVASMKSAHEDLAQRLEDVEEARGQVVTELESARETMDAAIEREQIATRSEKELRREYDKTIEKLGAAAVDRDTARNEVIKLRKSLSLASKQIEELKGEGEK